MNQLSFPSTVTVDEVKREKTLGGAIGLCAKVAGLEAKQVQDAIKADRAQWSRWESGGEGIVWSKFQALMDFCGNDAPLLWMVQQRGYELSSLRRQETELELEVRLLREQLETERRERETERRLFKELRAVA